MELLLELQTGQIEEFLAPYVSVSLKRQECVVNLFGPRIPQ